MGLPADAGYLLDVALLSSERHYVSTYMGHITLARTPGTPPLQAAAFSQRSPSLSFLPDRHHVM